MYALSQLGNLPTLQEYEQFNLILVATNENATACQIAPKVS
jgi:hypothetical protein